MTAVFGWFDLRGAPASSAVIGHVATGLAGRGAGPIETWFDGPLAFGSSLGAARRDDPTAAGLLRHPSGCVAVGDVKLHGCDELCARLGLARRPLRSDLALVVEAWLRWGDRSMDHVVGEFTFALWEPAQQRVTLVRDHLGCRRLVYHLRPGALFAFATDLSVLLRIPGVPHALNEARIADYLTEELEGIDHASTVIADVQRLPPAHALSVSASATWHRRVWQLPEREVLRRGDDREHVEEFLEVFGRAVSSRLDLDTDRTTLPAAAMLSGGLDSGTVAHVASSVLAAAGRTKLHAFTAVSAHDPNEIDSRLAHSAAASIGATVHEVDAPMFGRVEGQAEMMLDLAEEPFDLMTPMIWALYGRAAADGFSIVLDGAGGDVVLTEGNRTGRLVLSGHPRAAYRGLAADNEHWEVNQPPWRIVRSMVGASLPVRARRLLQRRRSTAQTDGHDIAPDLAARIDLAGRFAQLDAQSDALPVCALAAQRTRTIGGPMLTVGIERYDRIAGRLGVEARGPFLDRRVVERVMQMPDHLLHDRGWHKMLLRRAAAGRLPDEVRWKRGRDHVGWEFMAATADAAWPRFMDDRTRRLELVGPFLASPVLKDLSRPEVLRSGDDAAWSSVRAVLLSEWLARQDSQNSPVGSSPTS